MSACLHRCCLALVAVPLLVAGPVMAAQLELQVGRSTMDGHGADAAFVEGVFAAHPLGNSGLRWSPDLSLGWIGGRDLARFRDARPGTRDASWLAAGGVRLQAGGPDGWYRHFYGSFQLALHGGRTQALGTAYQFVSTLGWQWHHFSLQLRHVSNGNFQRPNRGETMALLGVGFEL